MSNTATFVFSDETIVINRKEYSSKYSAFNYYFSKDEYILNKSEFKYFLKGSDINIVTKILATENLYDKNIYHLVQRYYYNIHNLHYFKNPLSSDTLTHFLFNSNCRKYVIHNVNEKAITIKDLNVILSLLDKLPFSTYFYFILVCSMRRRGVEYYNLPDNHQLMILHKNNIFMNFYLHITEDFNKFEKMYITVGNINDLSPEYIANNYIDLIRVYN